MKRKHKKCQWELQKERSEGIRWFIGGRGEEIINATQEMLVGATGRKVRGHKMGSRRQERRGCRDRKNRN